MPKFCAKVLCESFVRKFWAKNWAKRFGRNVLFLEPHFESGAGCWAGLGWAGLGWARLGLGWAGLG